MEEHGTKGTSALSGLSRLIVGWQAMTYAIVVATLALMLWTPAARAAAQQARRPSSAGEQLLQQPAIKAAVERLKAEEPFVIDQQIRLCEIPAPPFGETARGAAYKQAFEALGLSNVRIDAVGNVLGERRGRAARPHVVFSAHLDTVFPEGTKVTTSRSGAILSGPGIGDDCRGLAVLLGVIRSMNAANLQTAGSITFVGTVGEEGLGDLRGVKHLFQSGLKGQIDSFVSIDGSGLEITDVAVGSLRYRVTFKGAGGHSYGDFGVANPVHALGRAVAAIGDLQVPREPRTTFNVGRVGGGTSVNSIAASAWMEVDLRSADPAALKALDAGFQRALDGALAAENERWENRGRLTLEKTVVGNRPGGRNAADSPIVAAALSVTRALGRTAAADEGSTDANIPISLGIPAITIGGGGTASGAHTLGETFDTTGSWEGTARALLLALALTEP
jgi:acetylornithine deacetylase/succinyl-diaminopimelate desuccinylase-like protein